MILVQLNYCQLQQDSQFGSESMDFEEQLQRHNKDLRGNRLQRFLFDYQPKVEVSIHFSLLSKFLMRVWRVIALVALSVRGGIILLHSPSLFEVFEYLTTYGFLLTWLYFALVNWDLLINHYSRVYSPFLSDWVNLSFEVSWCLQFPITLLYWVVLYSSNDSIDALQMIQNIGVHGFPLFCLIIDFIFNVYQFPLKHLSVVMGVGLIYLFINLGYTVETSPIYDPIDWVSVLSYIWVMSAVIIVVVVHLVSRVLWRVFRLDRVQRVLQSGALITKSQLDDFE